MVKLQVAVMLHDGGVGWGEGTLEGFIVASSDLL